MRTRTYFFDSIKLIRLLKRYNLLNLLVNKTLMPRLIFRFLQLSLLFFLINIGFISVGESKNKVPLIGYEQCRVVLPIKIKNDDWKSYAEYIFLRLIHDNLKPINVRPDLVRAESVRFGFGFTLSCPAVFVNMLMHEFLSTKVMQEFHEIYGDLNNSEPKFEQDGNTCLLSSNLPFVEETFPEQLRIFLKHHMLSFVDLKATRLNMVMNKYTFTFKGQCEDVLVDYYYQKLFPFEYFKDKSKTK